MKKRDRDKFMIHKSRLRLNEKFRALTPTEKWHWLDLCMFLDDQDKPGISRWELKRIAKSIGAPLEVLKSLNEQDVLKGSHEGKECEPYTHVDRRGKEHTLIPATTGPIWYSSAIVRDEYLRAIAARSGRRGGGNPALQIEVKSENTFGSTYIGRDKGVVKGAPERPPNSPEKQGQNDGGEVVHSRENSGGGGNGSPQVSFPPYTPLSSSPTPELKQTGAAGKKAPKIPDSAVEAIYQAYPRKVKRGHAITAIRKALARLHERGPTAPGGESWDSWLLEKVQMFAKAREAIVAQDPMAAEFTLYPASFFNAHSYDDDPAEWDRKAGAVYRAPAKPVQRETSADRTRKLLETR